MKCLVAGATGLVGGQLVRTLLADPRVETVVSMGRRAVPLLNPRFTQIAVAGSGFESNDEVPRVDAAFCCLGTTIRKAGSLEAFYAVDHDLVLRFAKRARASGARKFLLVSSLGADPASKIFYSRVKGEIERDLADVGFESLLIFRPSLLLGDRTEKRLLERLFVGLYPLYRPFLLGPLKAQAPISAEAVARSMVDFAFTETRGVRVILNGEMLARR